MKLMHRIVRGAKRELVGASSKLSDSKYRKIASKYDFHGYRRFYLVHIRKTGGTSLNHMFLALSGDDPSSLYHTMSANTAAPYHRVVRHNKIYVCWNVDLINRGDYFYGFSHTPVYKLDLSPKTFTVTCFRDPVKRVISHYAMLMEMREHHRDHPCMAVEGSWLGGSFKDFLKRIPPEHLLNQLYMFSESYNIDEATETVTGLSHRMFSDDFANGVDLLNQKTGLGLAPMHIRKSKLAPEISESDVATLREALDPEYEFLDRVRRLD